MWEVIKLGKVEKAIDCAAANDNTKIVMNHMHQLKIGQARIFKSSLDDPFFDFRCCFDGPPKLMDNPHALVMGRENLSNSVSPHMEALCDPTLTFALCKVNNQIVK
jgi:hypothetical protein